MRVCTRCQTCITGAAPHFVPACTRLWSNFIDVTQPHCLVRHKDSSTDRKVHIYSQKGTTDLTAYSAELLRVTLVRRDDAFAAGTRATAAHGAVPSANDGAAPSGGDGAFGGPSRSNVVLSFEGAHSHSTVLLPPVPLGGEEEEEEGVMTPSQDTLTQHVSF